MQRLNLLNLFYLDETCRSRIKTPRLIGVSGTDAECFAKSIFHCKLSLCGQAFYLSGLLFCFILLHDCPSLLFFFCLSAPAFSPPPISGDAASYRHAFYQVSHSPGYANAALVLTQSGCVLCLHGLAHNKWCPFSNARTAIVSHKLSALIWHFSHCETPKLCLNLTRNTNAGSCSAVFVAYFTLSEILLDKSDVKIFPCKIYF